MLSASQITDQLNRQISSEDFVSRSAEIVETWNSANIGVEAVDPILKFIEEHSSLDLGTPGPLVHFVEKFYRLGYEEKLLQSISRKPTAHSIWMLNRIINGADNPEAKRRFTEEMVRAKSHPLTEDNTLKQIDRCLERFGMLRQ